MARIDLSIPSLADKFIDVRDTIPGDSFNWSWIRSLPQVKYLAIHHSAGPDTQTPNDIANFHINSNGWGGIGYHFLISKDGVVYYVGDISTARANVANLNDQVIGICLVGNFTSGKEPTEAQIDSAHKLCEFFISHYPDLVNVLSWDSVLGHKDLPGQATTCPGDNWPQWRPRIISGEDVPSPVTPPTPSSPPPPASLPPVSTNRGAQITEAYRAVLGRDADMGGLQEYTNGPLTIDQIVWSMVTSDEHKEVIRLAKEAINLKDQINNMQTSLTSINQQVLLLQEALQEKDSEVKQLRAQIGQIPSNGTPAQTPSPASKPPPDNTLSLVDLFVNLYKFIFVPRKVVQ